MECLVDNLARIYLKHRRFLFHLIIKKRKYEYLLKNSFTFIHVASVKIFILKGRYLRVNVYEQ